MNKYIYLIYLCTFYFNKLVYLYFIVNDSQNEKKKKLIFSVYSFDVSKFNAYIYRYKCNDGME